jgi:hypothetical protein
MKFKAKDVGSHQKGNLLGLQKKSDRKLINKASFLKYCINANFMARHFSQSQRRQYISHDSTRGYTQRGV